MQFLHSFWGWIAWALAYLLWILFGGGLETAIIFKDHLAKRHAKDKDTLFHDKEEFVAAEKEAFKLALDEFRTMDIRHD